MSLIFKTISSLLTRFWRLWWNFNLNSVKSPILSTSVYETMFLNVIKAKRCDKIFLILMALHVYKTRQMHITSSNGMNK